MRVSFAVLTGLRKKRIETTWQQHFLSEKCAGCFQTVPELPSSKGKAGGGKLGVRQVRLRMETRQHRSRLRTIAVSSKETPESLTFALS